MAWWGLRLRQTPDVCLLLIDCPQIHMSSYGLTRLFGNSSELSKSHTRSGQDVYGQHTAGVRSDPIHPTILLLLLLLCDALCTACGPGKWNQIELFANKSKLHAAIRNNSANNGHAVKRRTFCNSTENGPKLRRRRRRRRPVGPLWHSLTIMQLEISPRPETSPRARLPRVPKGQAMPRGSRCEPRPRQIDSHRQSLERRVQVLTNLCLERANNPAGTTKWKEKVYPRRPNTCSEAPWPEFSVLRRFA